MDRRLLWGGGALAAVLVLGAIVFVSAGPDRTQRFLIVSTPKQAVIPFLREPALLRTWVPQALAIPAERFSVAEIDGAARLVWHERAATTQGAGEPIGVVRVEPGRIGGAARIFVEGPDRRHDWRFRFSDAGRYGLGLTLHDVYYPGSLKARLGLWTASTQRHRALERGLSLLRGGALARFGAAGGTYKPPASGPAAAGR